MASRAIMGGMAPSLAKAPSPAALVSRHGLTAASSTITGGGGSGGAKSTAATSIIPRLYQKATGPDSSSAFYGVENADFTNEAFQSCAAAMSPPPFCYVHSVMPKSGVESTTPGVSAVPTLDGFGTSGLSGQSRGYAQSLNASFGIFEEVKNGPVMTNMNSNGPTVAIKRLLPPVEVLTVSGRDMLDSEIGKMTANSTRTLNSATISTAESIEKSLSANNFGQDVKFSSDANVNVSISITSVSTTSTNVVSNAATSEALDERKQKRMLSNRESARRSRVRKQQHLDDLRVQVARLRAENDLMKSKYNNALQHYTRLTEENHVLRSHVIHLSHQLHKLHQAAIAHQQAIYNFQSLGIEPELLDPIPITPYLLNCP